MNLVRESIHFERGGDLKDKMGIGIPYKNPMPSLNSYIDNGLKDPKELDFGALNLAFDIARRKLMNMILAKGMYEEFGESVKSFGDDPSYTARKIMILEVNNNGTLEEVEVRFNPSNEYVSFYAHVGKPINDATGYSRSVKNLVKGIRKKFKKEGITV